MFTFKLVSLQTLSADNNFTAKLLVRLLKALILSPVPWGKKSSGCSYPFAHFTTTSNRSDVVSTEL